MKIHLIAIGGSVMHNLAIALQDLGHEVSGSDDEIYDPAKERLAKRGLLPEASGWDPARIHTDLDLVILGMHAKKDNPELKKAQELGLTVTSFPEFIYQHCRSKQRIVIGGSHGKTTITSMVMHVLKEMGRDFDYLVGAQLEGFNTMVRLSEDAPVAILEGDEYLSSKLDSRPKFLAYKPHMALISGIAWDHINVFPTEKEYEDQFALFIRSMPKAGMLIYNEEDKLVKKLIKDHGRKEDMYFYPYKSPDHRIRDGKFEIKLEGIRSAVELIGRHNMSNIAGAWQICKLMAIRAEDFLKHISTFKGAARRMEKIYEDAENNLIFKDYAHSPSKVKATVDAVRELFGKHNIVAILELHTFSSLNKAFLHQYRKTLKALKNKIIFINEHTLMQKNYPAISRDELVEAFEDEQIEYATSPNQIKDLLGKMRQSSNNVYLMMSSGNFANMDPIELVNS